MELQKGHGDWDPRVTGVSQSHVIYCLHNMGFKSALPNLFVDWCCILLHRYKLCAYFVFDQLLTRRSHCSFTVVFMK